MTCVNSCICKHWRNCVHFWLLYIVNCGKVYTLLCKYTCTFTGWKWLGHLRDLIFGDMYVCIDLSLNKVRGRFLNFQMILPLKGQCRKIFCFWCFSWVSFPPAPEYPIRTVSNFFENSRRHSQVKVHHRYQRHRWQNCHKYQRHRLLILVANLPPVSMTPVVKYGNNIRQQIPHSELEGKNLYIC